MEGRSRQATFSSGRQFGGVLVALCLHGVALLWLRSFVSLNWSHDPPPVIEEDVAVVPVSPTSWERNLGAEPSLPEAPGKSRKKESPPPPEALPQGQVVDVARGNDQKPADAKYLAEHDNRVAKETRAKQQTPFYGKAMPQQTAPDPKEGKDQKLLGNQGSGSEDAQKKEKLALAAHEVPATLDQQKVAKLERSEDGKIRAEDSKNSGGNSNHLQVAPGALAAEDGSDGKAGSPDATSSAPAHATQGETAGAAPNDFLNVPIGDGTFLNTREFKYASFFNRVKQRVGEEWKPNDVLATRGLHRDKAITVVDVILDATGRLAGAQVSQSSGIEALDTEAVAAFQRAQPFPNPPAALVDPDGHIRFRFQFHVDNEPGRVPLLRGRHGRW